MDDSLRTLWSPLTKADLRPLGSSIERVQFLAPLSDAEHKQVATLLKKRPEVEFRGSVHEGVDDLEFLQHYRDLAHVSLSFFGLKDLCGLQYLRRDLKTLELGATKASGLSLAPLERFTELRALSIEGQWRDFEVVAKLKRLRELHLRSITLPNLAVVRSLKELRGLTLKLGGTTDLGDLSALKVLRYFEAFQVRGLADLSPVGKMKSLTHLFLQNLPQVSELPSLAPLKKLQWVTLEQLKGLKDLKPLAAAPNLQELALFGMKQLQLGDLQPLVGHRSLRSACVGLGSLKRNQQALDLLGVDDHVTDKFQAYAEAVTT
ncbi:MAG: hypothetical protein KDA44_14695 [Planctomycetales bacterium]|nr:hypothetical protein [Planctomycetales bacterium]